MNRSKRHPWSKAYPEGMAWNAAFTAQPLFTLLDEAVERNGSRPFIDFLGKKYSYQEVGRLVESLTQGFRKIGVKPGVHVGLLLPNCPYFVFCYYAILKAGGIVVALNPLLAEIEIARQLREAETELVVTLDVADLYDKLSSAKNDGRLRKIIVCRMSRILPFPKNVLFTLFRSRSRATIPDDAKHIDFDALLTHTEQFSPLKVDPHTDIAALLYTGGTTGEPKGVCLTHANLYVNTQQSVLTLLTAEYGKEKVLAILPFFHAFGMTAVMNTSIALGAEMIILPRFRVKELLKTIHGKKPSLFAAVPTLYVAINNAPDLQRYDLSSLKFCTSGGDVLPTAVMETFERHSGCRLLEGYGLTEASPVATFNPPTGAEKPGSIGLPLPQTVIDIVSLQDRQTSLPPGEKGEICVSGPQVMAGYWKDPEATAKVVIQGRLHSGDVGFMDDDGYLYFVDRIKGVIKSGGYTVYPRLVEAAIRLHPSVADVAVIGLPDPYWGQAVAAFVVPDGGQEIDKDGLSSFLEDRLSPFEIPKRFEFRKSLPRSVVGKLLKVELLAEMEALPETDARKPGKVDQS